MSIQSIPSVMMSVVRRECIRLYAVIANRYSAYTDAFNRSVDNRFISQSKHDQFCAEASEWLDSVVPEWSGSAFVPAKLHMMVAQKHGRRIK